MTIRYVALIGVLAFTADSLISVFDGEYILAALYTLAATICTISLRMNSLVTTLKADKNFK